MGIFPAIWLKEGAGAYAARVSFSRGGSEEAFAMLDRLLEVGVLTAGDEWERERQRNT